MSTGRRKPNRHTTQPSWIGPPPSRRRYAHVPAVESHLSRATAPTQVQICPEKPGRKARGEDGVERHQAMRGHEAALLRRTPGNSRVPEAMVTSRVGRSDGKPAFWPSGVRSGRQTRGRRWRRGPSRRCPRHRSSRPTASHTSPDADRTRPSTDPVGRPRPVPWRAFPSPPSQPPPSRARHRRHTCEHKIQC